MECTRCHDHKYDPLTMRDYYGLSAFFANIDEAGLYSYFTPAIPTPTLWLPDAKQEEEHARISKEVADLEAGLAARAAAAKADYESWLASQSSPLPLPQPVAFHDFDSLKDGAFPNLVANGAPRKRTRTTSSSPAAAARP